MKKISKIIDDIIDIVHENTYSEIEEYHDEDGAGYEINLSPKPELYDKLNAYFAKRMPLRALLMYIKQAIDVVKGYFNQKTAK